MLDKGNKFRENSLIDFKEFFCSRLIKSKHFKS